ncbi:MAG: hypothetical protein LBD87_03420 [Prevotellaceae bacterium]|nr:hypothetical protein [Prevotellaceae bacterium]
MLDNLQLTENNYLKRATVLLFHPKPEKFVTGAFIKIGFFRSESDLQFQDDIPGNLFEQAEKTEALLNAAAMYGGRITCANNHKQG